MEQQLRAFELGNPTQAGETSAVVQAALEEATEATAGVMASLNRLLEEAMHPFETPKLFEPSRHVSRQWHP